MEERKFTEKEINDKARDIVSRDIYCNVGTLIEPLLSLEYSGCSLGVDIPFTSADIENYYPNHDDEIEELEDKLQELNDELDDAENVVNDMDEDSAEYESAVKHSADIEAAISDIEDKITDLRRESEEPQEIFEWWAVSDWFAYKMRQEKEPILDAGSCLVWGRGCTGQAIYMDGLIQRMAKELLEEEL